MQARGIEFRLGTRAQAVTEEGVRLADGSTVAAGTVVCTIGTTTTPLLAGSGLPLERGRVRTESDMRVVGHANVWALGDCALVPNAHDGRPSPTLAQFALRQAKQLAANARRVACGKPSQAFSFRMLGEFASIGHRNAVGQVLGLKVSGRLGWAMWRAVYLAKMPTVARKIQVAFDWALDLFFPRDIVQVSTRETRRVPRAHFEPGEFVFHQGDAAGKFYVIEKGKAAVWTAGWSEPIGFLGAGDHFGEGALLQSARRSVSIRAEEPLDVLAIDQGALRDVMEHLKRLRSELEHRVVQVQAALKFRDLVRAHPRLNAIQVRDAMAAAVRTLPQDLTIGDAVGHLGRHGHHLFAVTDDAGRLRGVCTTSDIHKAVCRLTPKTALLRDVMSQPALTVPQSKTLAEAMYLFLQHPVKRLVVVEDAETETPVGLITAFDVVLHYLDKVQEEAGKAVDSQPAPSPVG
jgi:NADH dehydrogenase